MTNNKNADKLIEFAKKFIGTPYKYGAKMEEAPGVFDCSGFVKYVFGRFGIELPRSTIEQAGFLTNTIKSIKKILTGDIIFFHGKVGHYNKKFPKGIGHVAIYTGDGKIIHASSKRTSDKPDKIKEAGKVKIGTLKTLIKKSGPVIVIKRVI